MSIQDNARLALCDVRGPLKDLEDKLSGEDGKFWAAALKKMLRRENPWPEQIYVIDLDADPSVPDGWEVVEHKRGGQLVWDLSLITLYLSPRQLGKYRIEGHELRAELESQFTLNANALRFYLAHPYLIPPEWKTSEIGYSPLICFWATIYRDAEGCLYILCLRWEDGHWCARTRCLSRGFNFFPAVVRTN